jgi:hypothetical protein
MAWSLAQWWRNTKAEYQVQKILRSRDNIYNDLNRELEASRPKNNSEPGGRTGLDKLAAENEMALRDCAFRKEQHEKNPNRMESISKLNAQLEQISSHQACKSSKYAGSGFGAFFGRLFNGRLTAGSRNSSDAISSKWPDPAQNEALTKQTLDNKPEKNLKEFQEAAKEKRSKLKDNEDIYIKQFFGDLPDNAFRKENIGGLQTLNRRASRLSMARLYMYSKNCSLDQIYGDSPANEALRKQHGKELTEILLSGDADKIGKLYADIGKSVMNFPMPDISSDAALFKNMREINFLYSIVDYQQSMDFRAETGLKRDTVTFRPLTHENGKVLRPPLENMHELNPVEKAFREHTTEEEQSRISAMMQNNSGMKEYGVYDRLLFITEEFYSNPTSDNLSKSSLAGVGLANCTLMKENNESLKRLDRQGLPLYETELDNGDMRAYEVSEYVMNKLPSLDIVSELKSTLPQTQKEMDDIKDVVRQEKEKAISSAIEHDNSVKEPIEEIDLKMDSGFVVVEKDSLAKQPEIQVNSMNEQSASSKGGPNL